MVQGPRLGAGKHNATSVQYSHQYKRCAPEHRGVYCLRATLALPHLAQGLRGWRARRCENDFRLLEFSLRFLSAVAKSGGKVFLEHPEDPGRDPFPSIWATDEMNDLIDGTGADKLDLDQCRFDAPSQKPTTICGTAPGMRLFLRTAMQSSKAQKDLS